MSRWRHLTHGMRALLRPTERAHDVDEEVQHFLEEATAAGVARGLTPEEARHAALVQMGGAAAARDEVRAHGWENAVQSLAVDFRYAMRWLRASPGFVALTALTIAFGVGTATAVFSVANPILLQPLPYPHAERLVTISDHGPGGSWLDVTFGTYREMLARSRSFSGLAVMKPWQPVIAGTGSPERLEGQRVSAGYFDTLGVAPAAGLDFDPTTDRPHGPATIIIANRLWKSRFGSDPAIIGREIRLDGEPFTIVGVMPAQFENVLAPNAVIWSLLQYDPTLPLDGPEWGHHLRMIGRLRAGVPIARAQREVNDVARNRVPWFPRAPWAALRNGLSLRPLRDEVSGDVRPALLGIMAAVALLLAIVCANVTHLLLARGVRRRGEFAVRAALGAGPARIIRQIFVETLLMAGAGGVAGVAIGVAAVRMFVAAAPPQVPRLAEIGFNPVVFLFAIAITALVAMAAAIVPALHAGRTDPQAALRERSRTAAGNRSRARRILVAGEVALALVLLIGTGLLMRSLFLLLAVDPGFVPSRLLTMQIQTAGERFSTDAAKFAFFSRALEAVRSVPGVTHAASSSQLPLTGDVDEYGVHFEGDPAGRNIQALRYAVSPGYFETMGIPLLRGRTLEPHDAAGAGAAILSASLAKEKFGDGDPIGSRIQVGDGPQLTVVGVAGDVKQASLATRDASAVYFAPTVKNSGDAALWLVVRSRPDALDLAASIRRAIHALDADVAISRVSTMDERLLDSESRRRETLSAFTVFAAIALLLAGAGVYGVLAGGVAEQRREIGIRAALGASRRTIVIFVVRQAIVLTAIGVALGLTAAVIGARSLLTLLFGITPFDPLTYAGSVALLTLVAAIASSVPAWRAARVDPAITLRAE